jgi:hypothetical protein
MIEAALRAALRPVVIRITARHNVAVSAPREAGVRSRSSLVSSNRPDCLFRPGRSTGWPVDVRKRPGQQVVFPRWFAAYSSLWESGNILFVNLCIDPDAFTVDGARPDQTIAGSAVVADLQ